VTEIFFYLIENFNQFSNCPDAKQLTQRLTGEGFDENEVYLIVTWLERLRTPLECTIYGSTDDHGILAMII
jgi:uncharacterized protein Smg (DUF494 family)